MTVSLTKEEVGWIFSCLNVATQDADKEFDKELLDAVKRIEEKLRMAQVKETLKRKQEMFFKQILEFVVSFPRCL